ncbi:hypothetical protein [Synechococcus sp. PCC 7336]|uniref:hypothetical protein n=1 Tax=Synechococcus sp. PCC 7336 TaxID=195250 RepID=UPI00034C8D80|nr:hypothetical protein [Synechococcus sp. PCC 7336]
MLNEFSMVSAFDFLAKAIFRGPQMSIDQLMQEALSLPNNLRLQLAEELLASLEAEVDETIQSD